MLMPCEQCGQVVEVAGLAEHLANECEESQPFRYPPPLNQPSYRGCPLCATGLPEDPELLKRHLMHECPANTRRTAPSA